MTAIEEFRGVVIDSNNPSTSFVGLFPNEKDLFISGIGFDAISDFTGPIDFAQLLAPPNCLTKAGLAVHIVNFDPDNLDNSPFKDNNLDVVVVQHDPEAYPGLDGHINHEGNKFWPYDSMGRSYIGTADAYGSDINYTKSYHLSWKYYFLDRTYVDWNDDGWQPPYEDLNDDGILKNQEDTGDPDWSSDHAFPESDYLDETNYALGLNPNNLNNIQGYWVTLGGDSDPMEVLKSVVLHEIVHSIGVALHCDNSFCVMNNYKIDFVVDEIGDYCKAKIQIHND